MSKLNKILPVSIIILLAFFSFDACKSSGSTKKPKRGKKTATVVADSFDGIKTQNWLLCQITVGAGDIILKRQEMAEHNLGDVYTLQITNEGLSGKAAPNKYFAAFASNGAGGDSHSFTLQQIKGTPMAANINVGGLMEPSYYWYLQRATKWQLNGQYLLLYTQAKDDTSQQIIMIYQPGPQLPQ
ncbi:MAG: hypothetical protein Ta2B_03260 [Termitinemataceae bacterium]|nr:MAG: hypothetical protein Ta2B_03260 [Termitinemataceae bacterium]